jgi:hypothetical protein
MLGAMKPLELKLLTLIYEYMSLILLDTMILIFGIMSQHLPLLHLHFATLCNSILHLPSIPLFSCLYRNILQGEIRY